MGGASHKYAVRWPTSYKILAVSVQTRVELPCFIVHLEFFSPRQGSLQEIRLSWMRSGHQSESFNQRSRFPKDHSRSRGPILFCKVGSWLLSPHLQPYDMAFLCLDFGFQWGFLWVQKQVPILFQAQLKLRFLTSQGGKILWFFRAQIWLDFGGWSQCWLWQLRSKEFSWKAPKLQTVELFYVLDSTSGHIFSWLHQKKHFFCLGDGVRIQFFFWGLLEDEENLCQPLRPGWSWESQ